VTIVNFTPVPALLGGILLGLAAGLLFLGVGRIAGISGMTGGLFRHFKGDVAWRVSFIAGLLVTGLVTSFLWPTQVAYGIDRSMVAIALAGLLVGFGARLGGGCTSGHGVCGLARFSFRSLVGVCVFMGSAMVTVFLINRLFGGSI
jgi:uncharacterized membrane protein YedE/YeeE